MGGFHLAVDATSEPAVRRLRERKQREEKPFAVMVASLADAEQLAILDPAGAELLASRERPIVLLPARRYQRLGYRLVGELADYIVSGHSELLLRKTRGPLAP